MAAPVWLALGVEEEFQLVDAKTGTLVPGFERLMDHATKKIRHHLKPEYLQCVVECVTDICPDVATVRDRTAILRATAASLARTHGMALISAGTHPFSKWMDQLRTPDVRYKALEAQLQDVARSISIYGLHVHVNIPDEELRVLVMNQARSFLPHILAFSANSPFWMGRNTGYMAYRTIVWAPFPMAGIPDAFADLAAYLRFRDLFQRVNSLSKIRRLWWDLRLHHEYPTLEFRIADMPLHHEDTVAIIALIQGLCKTLIDRTREGRPLPVQPSTFIHENRWRAALGGPHGVLVDFEAEREIPAAEALGQTLDLVSDAMVALGAQRELAHLRQMLHPQTLCGAEQQIATYLRRENFDDVVSMLMRETLAGIDLRDAMPLATRVPVAAASAAPRARMRLSDGM